MDFYHVLNRGVEKRNIVMHDDDRMRFIRSLYMFNDARPVHNASSSKGTVRKKRTENLLVHIHAWCLMDNHYHLLLSPVNDKIENLSLFIKKLNGGYAKFFNEKYDRSGYLWQGKTKKILIKNDAQFLYIPYYIHLNPLDYSHKNWRNGSVKNTTRAIKTLHDYRWSSFNDYSGKNNFPSLLSMKALTKILGTTKKQTATIKDILQKSYPLKNSDVLE